MAGKKSGGYDSLMKELKRQLRLNGRLRELAPDFGMSQGQLYNLFSHEAETPVSFICELPSKVSVSLGALLRKGLLDTFEDPLNVLLSQRERPTLPANAFLDELDPRVRPLLAAKVDSQLSAASHHPLIDSLEEQRYQNRTAACDACEALILQLVQMLEDLPGSKPRRLLGELAAALALWATIQRSRGFRDLAVKAFTLAFPVAFLSGDAWAKGCCFYRASFLLGDLGRNDLAFEFNREAFVSFSGEGTSINLWKSYRARGHFLVQNGRPGDAREAFELALEHLPGSEWRDRVSALQGLGVITRRQGKPLKARRFLESAAAECKRTDIVLGHIHWSRGLVELDLGNLEASQQFLEKATALLGKFGSAGDVALVCVDHVEVLLQQKEAQRAALIVSEVATWLPQMRANPILCRAFGQFLDLARAARIELAQLPRLRDALKKAGSSGEAP